MSSHCNGKIGPCVSIFGSARTKPNSPYYELAEEIAKKVTEHGYGVITGGGPGIMEAANKGAFENDGYSVGCNIVLPREQKPNPYLHKWIDNLLDKIVLGSVLDIDDISIFSLQFCPQCCIII